jgi:Protein of unknown function (DUF3040)
MLSDGERRRLTEIESSLRADDARFVQRFESRRRARGRNALALLAIITAVAVTVTALAVHSVLFAVGGLVGVGATVGIWLTYRRR